MSHAGLPEPAPKVAPAEVAAASAIAWGRLRYLVVEDSPTMRVWLRNAILAMGGKSVDQAVGYSDALHRLRNRENFDVILCDYILSEERATAGNGYRAISRDGQHLLEECRSRKLIPTAAVFIMITGERTYERVFAAAELAPDDYLLKPLTPNSLSERLTRAYLKRQAMKPMTDLYDNGAFEPCITACTELLASGTPYDLDCLKLIGESLMALQRYDDAHRHFETVLLTHPALPWARLGAARAFFHLDRYDESQSILEDLLTSNADLAQAHDLLANIHETKGDSASSRAIIKQILAKNPRAVNRHREVVRLALEVGDEEDARKALGDMFAHGIGSSAMKPADFCSYSMLLLQDGGDAAQQRLTQVIGALNDHYLAPGNNDEGGFRVAELAAQFARARVSGDANSAERFYRQLNTEAREQNITDNGIRMVLMEAAAQQGDEARALDIAKEVLGDYVGNEGMTKRIVSTLEKHDLGGAAARLRDISERAVLDMNRQAVAHAKSGQMKAAMVEFIQLASRSRNLSVTFNAALAIVRWLEANEYDEALARKLKFYLEFIGNRDPDNPKYRQLIDMAAKFTRSSAARPPNDGWAADIAL